MTTGLLGINTNSGLSKWRVNQAQSSASMLERMMRDELATGAQADVLDRAREVEELVKLHVLDRRDSLMLQLLVAQLLETKSEALNDVYARKTDYFVGNIFAAEELPEGQVRDESERFRVRVWLNRGNKERARHYANRIDRLVEVMPPEAIGQLPVERISGPEEEIRPQTWLLLCEVALAEKDFAEAGRALSMAKLMWSISPVLQEEKIHYELLSALEMVGRNDQSGCAALSHLFCDYVLNESTLSAQWRARISAAAGFTDQLDGISQLEASRWREIGPPDRELVEFYLGQGSTPPMAPQIFDDSDVSSLIDGLGLQERQAAPASLSRPVDSFLETSFQAQELPLDFSLQDKRIEDQTDILAMERATCRLVLDWSRCDHEQLVEAVQSMAIAQLSLTVSSGSIFINEGMYVDAALHTDDPELLGMAPDDVIFELYRIAMARLPRARARQVNNPLDQLHEMVRIKVKPKDFNMEVCRRIDVLNARLMGYEIGEEPEEEDPFANWNSFGPASQSTSNESETTPEAESFSESRRTPDLLEPFEAIFSANNLAALCQAAVNSVHELGAQGTRCEITTEDEAQLLACAGEETADNLLWSVLEAGPLRLRLGILSIAPEYQKLMRMVMDATIHRLRVMPGTRYRGLAIEVPGFIASDSRTQELLESVRVFAAMDKNILITGERGTGKEHIAHLVHKWSKRAARPFISVDAGLLNNPELLAAELYGSTKGSYTGSTKDRPGLVQAADGGVLFIDEIDEGVSVQSVLKRFAQFGTFKSVGRAQEMEVDVRLIIATNQIGDGGALIKEDLRDRFWEIRVPPLRERRDDIRPLAEHFARQFEVVLPDNVLAWLATLDWPGNIRQLENVVERACSLAQSPANLTIEFFDECVERSGGKTIVRMTSDNPAFIPLKLGETLNERLLEDEKRYILAAMTAAEGNKTRAAEMLGVQRQSLHARMKQLGLIEQVS